MDDLLDTARDYTNSENRIGLALRGIGKPVFLSTKSHARTAKIYDDVCLSLKQLRVKKNHIYHLHNIYRFEDYAKVMAPRGAYEGLKRARDEGLIDHIGMSSHSLDMLEKVIEDGYFDVVMTCYSFLEPDAATRIFSLARAKDIGVLIMKPFSGGVIEEAGPALRFVFSTPDIVPILGAESVEKALENWKIFTEGYSLTEEDRERIATLRQQFDRQFCRRCDYCQPCSAEIPIQHILGLKSILKRFGHMTQELGWVNSVIEKARNCSECGDCMARCPYQLLIPDLIRKNLAWYDEQKEL